MLHSSKISFLTRDKSELKTIIKMFVFKQNGGKRTKESSVISSCMVQAVATAAGHISIH